MKRLISISACVVIGAACSSGGDAGTAASTSAPSEASTTTAVVDGTPTTLTADSQPAATDGGEAAAPATTVLATETTVETIPQTTIDNGAPETTGPPITDPPPLPDEDDAVPPVELQAYTDGIAVACAKVEFAYLGLRDGFEVDPLDLADGASLAESEDPARYGDAAAALIAAAPGDRLELADAFLSICADQGYERL